MPDKREQLDPFETALLELGEVEKACVLDRTELDVRGLLHGRRHRASGPAVRIASRMLSAAAAVAIAIGLWGWFVGFGPTEVRASGFLDCYGGPTETADGECRAHDYDSDGDVDLVDYGTYQVAIANMEP